MLIRSHHVSLLAIGALALLLVASACTGENGPSATDVNQSQAAGAHSPGGNSGGSIPAGPAGSR